MTTQPSPDGWDRPTVPTVSTDRLFFALHPPPALARKIAADWQARSRALSLRGKAVEAERLHVTLVYLGDHPGLPPGLESAAREAASGLVVQRAFEVCFDRIETFGQGPGRQLQVLCSSDGAGALHEFQAALAAALRRAGLERWMDKRPGFRPHITLQYSRRPLPAQSAPPTRWSVTGFSLVNSKLGRHEHQQLAYWPLQP